MVRPGDVDLARQLGHAREDGDGVRVLVDVDEAPGNRKAQLAGPITHRRPRRGGGRARCS